MPSKKTSNERTEQIHIRVTPEEKKEIEDRAKKSGKTVARYLVGLSTTILVLLTTKRRSY